MRRVLVIALPLLGLGCPDNTTPKCPGFIGDATKPPEVELLVTDGASGLLQPVSPGGMVPLEPPPQGGYVVYATARVRNIDGCKVDFTGQFRNPAGGAMNGYDARTKIDLKLGTDGWGRIDASDNSNLTNVNPCPDYGAKNVQGDTWLLEVTAKDQSGRSGTASMPVVPTCSFSDPKLQANCICTCTANYTLGRCNSADAGM
jgi:hypothetical protein